MIGRRILALNFASAVLAISQFASAELLTYDFAGTITSVDTNEDNVIPGLQTGDEFTGYTTFESSGWHQTDGVVFASLNGVDLLFEGASIYGNVDAGPEHYAIRIGADAGGDIGDSTFTAGNFGPELEDVDGSAGHTISFPARLNLTEFETNIFKIWGTYLTGEQIFATGELHEFVRVPEPVFAWGVLVAVAALATRRYSFQNHIMR